MFQAVDGQTRAISAQTSIKMPTSRSAPPTRAGWAMRTAFGQVSLGLAREPPQPLALLGPCGDLRRQAPRPLEHFVVADAGKGRPWLGQVRRGSPLEPSRTLTLHRALPSRTWP